MYNYRLIWKYTGKNVRIELKYELSQHGPFFWKRLEEKYMSEFGDTLIFPRQIPYHVNETLLKFDSEKKLSEKKIIEVFRKLIASFLGTSIKHLEQIYPKLNTECFNVIEKESVVVEKYTMIVHLGAGYMRVVQDIYPDITGEKILHVVKYLKERFPECRVNRLSNYNYKVYVRQDEPFNTDEIKHKISKCDFLSKKGIISYVKHNPTRYPKTKIDIDYRRKY